MALGNTKHRSAQFIPPKLQITSMMDMFTIILIFLLFSFSESPDTVSLEKEIILPTSSADLNYDDSLKLVLSENFLKIGDDVVATVRDGKISGIDTGDLKTSELYKRLSELRREDEKATENKENINDVKEKSILFLCDKRLSFQTINNVVKTAGMAGYPNFQFGVLKE